MKRILTILAMLLIAATAYNQSSRRAANNTQRSERQNQNTRTVERTVTSSQHTTTRSTRVQQVPENRRSTTRTQSTPQSDRRDNRNYDHRSSNTRVTTTRTTTTTRHYSPRTAPDRRPTVTEENHYYASPRTRVEYRSPRVYHGRHDPDHHYVTAPASREYRARHYAYRAPASINIVWTPVMRRTYVQIYPMVTRWDYADGYRIPNISAYDAEYYMGEVMTVYGRVTDIYYSRATDEYFLYFGLYYPYQDFTAVIPGYVARRYSYRPSLYFNGSNIAVTGLITAYDNSPEIVVKRDVQVHPY